MTFHIGLPQGIYLALTLWGLVNACVKHGKPQGEYNAYVTLMATFLLIPLLWWGGFFR